MSQLSIINFLKALRFVFFPLYFLSFLIPKQKNLWVFGAHQNRFSENSKYLYLYTSQHYPNIKSIWITNDTQLVKELNNDGYSSFKKWSLLGIYYSLRARYYFYNVYSDDINFYTSGNTTLVNLWHGIPLKHIEFDIERGKLKKIFNSPFSFVYLFFKPYLFKNPHYVLSTSETVSKIFTSAFRIHKEQCLEFGYPRTDGFYIDHRYNTDANLFQNVQDLKKLKSQQIMLYMPTWRSHKYKFIEKAIPDFQRLNTTLKSNKTTLIVKLHPNDYLDKKDLSNILFINPKYDIYDILPISDFLITDYSSIYFDYLLLNKEIIFYAFDLNDYLNNERELYFNYKDITPGKKVYNFEDLIETISNLTTLNFNKERLELKNKLWKHQDSNASSRITDYFNTMA